MARKIDFSNCNEKQLWEYVGAHLAKNGIDAVLVGGAVVSIYSKGAYRSGDLDFIVRNLFSTDLPKVMAKIGFKKHGRHYRHPECKHLFIEFPSGYLSIGEETKISPILRKIGGIEIKILSPTDCIKDRLASYIHFKARDTLDQAVLVAKAQPIKIKEIEKWCINERAERTFEEFRIKIRAKKPE